MRRSIGLTALGMLAVVGMAEVPSVGAATAHPIVNTSRTDAPLDFRNDAFLDTRYLHRAVDLAEHRRGGAAGAASLGAQLVDPPDEARKKAEALAKRYGVAPGLAMKIVDVALAEGIDPELGFRVIRVESGFEPQARGARGATGLLQLMPSTARTVDRDVDTRKELFDPGTNLRVGFRYLRQLIERYDGDVRLGVLAYNRGELAVDRALKRGHDPENGYSHKVLGSRSTRPYTGHGVVSKAAKKK